MKETTPMKKTVFALTLTLALVACQTTENCVNCAPSTPESVPQIELKTLLTYPVQEASQIHHYKDGRLSPDDQWMSASRQTIQTVTFQGTAQHAQRSSSQFGIHNMNTGDFEPLKISEKLKVAAQHWLNNDEFVYMLYSFETEVIRIEKYKRSTQETTVLQADLPLKNYQVIQNDNWWVYTNNNVLYRLNLKSLEQDRFPIDGEVDRLHEISQNGETVGLSLYAPQGFTTQIEPPRPSLSYRVNWAQKQLEPIEPIAQQSAHDQHFSYSPDHTYLLNLTSFLSYAGNGTSSFESSSTLSLYHPDQKEALDTQTQTQPGSAAPFLANYILWASNTQFYGLSQMSFGPLYKGEIQNQKLKLASLSDSGFYLGAGTAKTPYWLELNGTTATIKSPEATLKNIGAQETLSEAHVALGATHAYLEIPLNSERVQPLMLDLNTGQVSEMPERKGKVIEIKVGDFEDWY